MPIRFRFIFSLLCLHAVTAAYAGEFDASKEATFEKVKGTDNVRVVVPKLGFEATFPGRPAFVDGQKILRYTQAAADAEFEVVWNTYGGLLQANQGNPMTINKFYNALVASIMRGKQGELQKSNQFLHEGRPAMSIQWRQRINGEPRFGYALMIAVGDTLYISSANQGAFKNINDADIDVFLKSLKPLAKAPTPKQADKNNLDALKAKIVGKWKGGRYLLGGVRDDRAHDEWWIIRPDGTYEGTKFIVTAQVTERGKWRIVDDKTLELTTLKGKAYRCGFTSADRSLWLRFQGLNEEVRLFFFAAFPQAQPAIDQGDNKENGRNPLKSAKVGDWAQYDLKMDGDIVSKLTYSVTAHDGAKATVDLASESVARKESKTTSRTIDLTMPYPVALLAGYREDQKIVYTKVGSEPETINIANREFKATRTDYSFRQSTSGLVGKVTIWTANDGPFDTLLKREIVVNGILTVRFSATLTAFGSKDQAPPR